LYVTGILLSTIATAQTVQPLSHAGLFMEETAIVLTTDEWRIALNIE
jgi:hypothetical protein